MLVYSTSPPFPYRFSVITALKIICNEYSALIGAMPPYHFSEIFCFTQVHGNICQSDLLQYSNYY